MGKIKVFALLGPSGCGKDTILEKVLAHPQAADSFHKIISTTTRPRREGEQDGVDYHFAESWSLMAQFDAGQMVEAVAYNDWIYGTMMSDYQQDKVNIGVFSPARLEILLMSPSFDVDIFYIKVKDKTRLLRQLNREEDPNVQEIIRRFQTDNEDFQDIEYDFSSMYSIRNETEKDLTKAVELIVGDGLLEYQALDKNKK